MDKKRITIIFLIVLTNAMAATAILPMLPLYVEGQFQATPVQAMLVIAAYYASQFVAAPWLGKLSDRFGRRPILIVSQVGTLGAYLLFLFAAPLGDALGVVFGMSGGLVVIYVARLMDGLTDGNVSVAEAYASDISDEKSRAHALGLIGGAGGLGHIIGPALAVVLSGISLTAPMVGAVVMGLVTLLLTILFLDESHKPAPRSAQQPVRADKSILQLLASRPVALVLAAGFIVSLYISTLYSSFSLYAERVLFPDQPAEVTEQRSAAAQRHRHQFGRFGYRAGFHARVRAGVWHGLAEFAGDHDPPWRERNGWQTAGHDAICFQPRLHLRAPDRRLAAPGLWPAGNFL